MALLEQLFRLRGAPRNSTQPVTLGALVAALGERAIDAVPKREEAVKSGREQREQRLCGDTRQADVPPATGPGTTIAGRTEPATRRETTRFNPFATANETSANPQVETHLGDSRPPQGPCRDDPALPPLRLKAQVTEDRVERPIVLGGPALADEAGPVLRQLETAPVVLTAVKSPVRPPEFAPPQKARPLMLRLQIEAEASLDVVAFKQHAAKFPGVVRCVIADGGS
jgi:hypothetical protein